MGTATASVQIEGGDKNNTWVEWCGQGHIIDSSSCITACDHWNRVAQDTELLRDLHVQTHRMSLEWSRIQPSPASFSEEAIQHYRDEIKLLLSAGIRPLVTLHHFSEPLWFHRAGGWIKPQNVELFIAYARCCIERLGDLVNDWVSFNEPNVYVQFGYVIGNFPPGHRNLQEALSVTSEMIRTHVKLYGMIHQIRKKNGFQGLTRVGAAIHLRIFDGITLPGALMARVVDYAFNELFMEGFTTGRLRFPLPGRGIRPPGGRVADFLGINYYTRNIVEFALDPSNYFHQLRCDHNLEKTDLGWDIYPKGIYQVCRRYYRRFRLPIYITENGISDKQDNLRAPFISDHLHHIARAIQDGIPVERYYHWTLMDNFEWLEGETANFGLYHNDFRTQKRTARKSAKLFAEICRRKELTEEMILSFENEIVQISK